MIIKPEVIPSYAMKIALHNFRAFELIYSISSVEV